MHGHPALVAERRERDPQHGRRVRERLEHRERPEHEVAGGRDQLRREAVALLQREHDLQPGDAAARDQHARAAAHPRDSR